MRGKLIILMINIYKIAAPYIKIEALVQSWYKIHSTHTHALIEELVSVMITLKHLCYIRMLGLILNLRNILPASPLTKTMWMNRY